MYLPNINIIIDIIIMGILFIRTNLYRKRTMTIGVNYSIKSIFYFKKYIE